MFDASTEWTAGGGMISNVKGTFPVTDECVQGYELHTGETITNERPLFMLRTSDGTRNEGSARPDEKLFGTYVHSLFDQPGFRRYVLKMTGKYVPSKYSETSYDKILNGTLDELADVFERSLDMKKFEKIFMEGER
jgi:adenosylcobyric acid synthase